MTGPDPTPDLTDLTSSQTLLEMGKVIQESREYFTAVCDGIGVQAEGELAYTYIFTLTRDEEPGFLDRIFGAPMEFDYDITNDEYHDTWIPKNGDIMPPPVGVACAGRLHQAADQKCPQDPLC